MSITGGIVYITPLIADLCDLSLVMIKGLQNHTQLADNQVPALATVFRRLSLCRDDVFHTLHRAGRPSCTGPGCFCLALLPTVLSLLFTMRAISCTYPTPTAIFGALEPITAVVLSIIILAKESLMREVMGGAR